LEATCTELVATLRHHLHRMEFRKAADTLCALWTAGNQYIDERAPWALFKQNPDEAAVVIRTCLNLIRIYAIASSPFIPFTCDTICQALQLSESERRSPLSTVVDFHALQPDRPFQVPPPLFQKLDDEQIAELRSRFGGE
jgi:methionyl-tRNA synthetase